MLLANFSPAGHVQEHGQSRSQWHAGMLLPADQLLPSRACAGAWGSGSAIKEPVCVLLAGNPYGYFCSVVLST